MSEETNPPVPPEELEGWVAEVKLLLGLEDEIDIAAVLGLAKDFAHNVARPAAPLTTFALGLAVGRAGGGTGDDRDFKALAERLRARSFDWQRD